MNELPQFLRDMIACPPVHGGPDGGIHGWLFRVSRQLHAHRSEEDIFLLLEASLVDCGRLVPPKEIADAITHSAACAWRPGTVTGNPAATPARQWPAIDQKLRGRVIEETSRDLYNLWEASSIRYEDDDDSCRDVLPQLYPGDPLVCAAIAEDTPFIQPLSQILGCAPACQFIVPSPMAKPIGKNQEGKDSIRCLDSTGPRKYLIVEFDSGEIDEQASILWHLATKAALVMVVHSGGKGLRGWFCCHGLPGARLRPFFDYACRVGADEHSWNRCAFDRMPGGTRDDGARQRIYYFAPEVLL
jgi:hypothetical protein